MAITKKSIEILNNLDVKNLSEEHMEIVNDMFEVSSFILSQIEIEEEDYSINTVGRGEA